jgi:superfamily I DNA/RNA helicase
VGVEEDILPHKLALLEAETDEKKKEAVEEERRICYVGMTRAKKQLFISYCKSRLERDGRNFNEVSGNPSRFIYEARLLKSKVPANFDDMQNKTRAR